MPRYIKVSTVKHEADTYFSQGLYSEALGVYQNFLSNARDLDPKLKKIVHASMDRIRSAAVDIDDNIETKTPEKEPAIIEKKTDGPATVEDRLAIAKEMTDAGQYHRALDEYHRLLEKKYITSNVIKGVTHCLVHLVRPKHIALVIDRFADEIFNHPRNKEVFKLSIAKKVCPRQYPAHYSALSHYLI